MNGNFDPEKLGFEPIPAAENAAGIASAVPPENPAAAAAVSAAQTRQVRQYQGAKKAFSRVGLAVILMFLVMQVLGTLVAFVGIFTNLIQFAFDFEFQATDSFEDMFRILSEEIQRGGLNLWSVVGTVLGLGAAILVEWLVLKGVKTAPVEKRRLSAGGYFFMMFTALGLWGTGALIGNLPGLVGLKSPLDSMFGGEGISGIVMCIYAMIGAPVLEELAFRKLMLDKLHAYGEVPAAFLTALLFGMYHGNSTQFLLAFAVGLAFAAVYLKTGNIWYSISFHMIINTIGSVAQLLDLFAGITEIGGISLDAWTYIVIGALAVIGLLTALIGRKNPLLALRRPDYLGAHSTVFRNAGFIIFTVISVLLIGYIDIMALVMNLMAGAGALSLVCLVPNVLFLVCLFVLLVTVGTHTESPAGEPEQPME